MSIPIRYSYKNYPFSKKATNYSRSLGIMTSWGMCVLWGFFWTSIWYGILEAIGLSDNIIFPVIIVSYFGLYHIVKKIKEKLNKKIAEIALKDLMELQKTNPQEFLKYVNMMK